MDELIRAGKEITLVIFLTLVVLLVTELPVQYITSILADLQMSRNV